MDNQYRQSPASAFSTAAREAPTSERLTIWAWCPTLGERVHMTYSHDSGKYEVYCCPCGQYHSYAVR